MLKIKKVKAQVKHYALYTPDEPAVYGVFEGEKQVGTIKASYVHAGRFSWSVLDHGTGKKIEYGVSLKRAKIAALAYFVVRVNNPS